MDTFTKHKLMAIIIALISIWYCKAEITYQCSLTSINWSYQDTIIQGIRYRHYNATGLDETREPRLPQLPVKLLRFSVPYNAVNIAVTVTGGNHSMSAQQSIYKIIPVAVDHLMSENLAPEYIPDSVVYNSNAFYPNASAIMVGHGIYQGENRIVTVAVYPKQYNPISGRIITNKSVNFSITYDLSPVAPSDVMVRNDINLRQKEWNEVKSIVVNPIQVEDFAPGLTAVQQIQGINLPDSLLTSLNDSLIHNGGDLASIIDTTPQEYLIITTRDLKTSYRRLAALKQQKGYSVGIRCIEDIVADPLLQCGDSLPHATYPIKDDAGKLRQYLRYSHQLNKTRFVLLGGKSIPFRFSANNTSSSNLIPTDQYFVDLTTNWNLNNNTLYAEEYCYRHNPNHHIDLEPELYVGRLETRTKEEVSNYTTKLLRYELNPGNGNASYLNRLFINQGFNESWKSNLMPLFKPTLEVDFSVTAMDQMNEYYPTGIDVIHEINSTQYGILSINGHGAPVSVNINNTMNSFIKTLDHLKSIPHTMGLDSLNNKNYPNIFYSNSCHTIPFDSDVFNLGQSFTLGKNYGGIAFIGHTRDSFSRADSILAGTLYLEKLFFEAIHDGCFKIGIDEARSKVDYHNNCSQSQLYIEAMNNLIGDPEFDIWTDEPSNYTEITVSRSNTGLQIGGISIGDTIAYCSNTNQGRKVAESSQVTLNNVNPNSCIMVYKHNKLPYIAPLVLQNTTIGNSQYVIAGDVVAGRNVDSGRTVGDVTISSGAEYEIEHKGFVMLGPGFMVENGATLSITPSDY